MTRLGITYSQTVDRLPLRQYAGNFTENPYFGSLLIFDKCDSVLARIFQLFIHKRTTQLCFGTSNLWSYRGSDFNTRIALAELWQNVTNFAIFKEKKFSFSKKIFGKNFEKINVHLFFWNKIERRICASLRLRIKFKTLFMRNKEKHGHFY